MNSVPQTATPPAPTVPATPARAGRPSPAELRSRLRGRIPLARLLGLVVVVALSAVLNIHRLAQNGYANIFYSAGVKSMLHSLHNFLYVSFDPGGLVTVDKPPLGLWLQAASAKVFGFSPLSLLLPEALAGVLAVALLYLLIARRMGTVAALAGGLALAVFPSFVAVSRDNGVDPLLILLMVMACWAGLRATETGRWRELILCGVLVGLAFNTKTLAAYLIVPPIALAYLVCAPGSIGARVWRLLLAGAVMLAVSFAWIAFVELTPASKRPFVGSSTNNTELGLTFEYNGLGRVEGEVGGPGDVHGRPGARVLPSRPAAPPPSSTHAGREVATGAAAPKPAAKPPPAPPLSTFLPDGRYRNPIPFGDAPSPVRLFGKGLGGQAGWMLPFALFGLIALIVLALAERRAPADARDGPSGPRGRRDPRLALTLMMGGWFLVEAAVLSLSKGIVHPYYVSALAPATGAMAGAGAVALVALRKGVRPGWGTVLAALAILGSVAAQIVLLEREEYMLWFVPVLFGVCTLAVGLLAVRRSLAAPAMAVAFVVLLIAPTAYSATTWLAPVEGTFAAAGPKEATGDGGYAVGPQIIGIDRALIAYVGAHRPGRRWALLTVASETAAPFILLDFDAGAVGGYSGIDPAVNGPRLAGMVARGEARYVLLGGEFSSRGGNLATAAVLDSCRALEPSTWHSPLAYPDGVTLFDCAGRERQLEAEPRS